MPRVPTYDGPQVREQALRPVQQREIDVSSGLRAASQAVAQMGDLADRTVRRDAETEVNRIDAEVTAGWLEWDAANRRKFQGQNVDQYEAEARKWWEEAKAKHTASNPYAQPAIENNFLRKRNQALGSVLGHVGAEKERFADSQSEAAAQYEIEFGVDTGNTAGAAARVRAIAAEKGKRKGWTTELVQAEQQRLLGTLHLSAITRLAEADPTKARAYYDANKAEIPATAQPRVEQVLKAEGDNQFATQFAAQHAALPLSEQLTKASEIKDPERREKALGQIRNNHAMVKQAQAEREQAASDQAWQMVGSGKRVPELVLAQMNGRERVQLQDYLKERAKIAASGVAPETDWATYIDLREKLAAGEKVDLRPYAGTRLAPAQLEQLLDIQTKTKDPKKMPEVATSEQQIGAFTRTLGLKKEKLGQFQAAAQDRFNQFLKATGKEPSYDDRQKILDDLNKTIVTDPGWLWDSKGPAFEAPKAKRDAALGPAAAPADKFTVGNVYRDGAGNRAKYLGGGKWEPVK